ncbi:nucleoside-diphosphate-sugar epimerase [Nonomuraea polychroma]|uniref:Nucleoside-diphosphate-sugar epimerase n=1 Tax=Nonomuraea polychroma TaxID=46176 RepID=A0A438MDC0_9ACTN|nr:SDR family oxidoreductase [Nonomuraea polychroma]RVX43541.1 nucleoside-diphosphate-sugar epimerase [Nonomuraea polychroma]
MTSVLVTGASGRLGHALLERLVETGFEVRAASRAARAQGGPVRWVVADLVAGRGVADAVAGVDVVVHLASAPYKGRYTRRVELDGTSALLAAARQAAVGHLLYVSIVGADQVPWGYFRTKVRAERLVQDGGVPWTILRATQFHEFVEQALRGMARLGVLVADPGIPAQPVDVRDVARHLVSLIERGPSEQIEEYGGPEVLTMAEVVEPWLRARGLRRKVLRVRFPGTLGRAFRAGHLTTKAQPAGEITWDDYLRNRR